MEPEATQRKRKLFTNEQKQPDSLVIPDLPPNARLVVSQRSFSMEEINDLPPGDRAIVMQVVTYCCHTIAKQIRLVSVSITETTHFVAEVPFKCYVAYAKFPMDMNVFKKHDLDRLQAINATFVRDLRTIREADGNAIDMNIYSTTNKFAIKDLFITHIHQEHVILNTYENDIEDGRGNAKRPRSSSVSSTNS